MMAAPKNNQFWLARSSHGRKPKFKTPKKLWEACTEYFSWIEQNPLREGVVYQGKVMEEGRPIMRAMTLSGLCLFLDICEQTWANYRNKDDFLGVTTRVESVIYNQKFAGAAAGLFNANIIARDLGLTDKQQVDSKTAISLKPASQMTLAELEALLVQASKDFTDEITAGGHPIDYDHLSDEELRAMVRAGEPQKELTASEIQQQIDELIELKKVAKKKGTVTV